METIGEQKIWSFAAGAREARPTTCGKVRNGSAHNVSSFMDLATKVAALQFMNRDFVLLFRGQRGDYKNKSSNTSLKPTLFRAAKGNPDENLLQQRFERLREAEARLTQAYVDEKLLGRDRITRQQILRWAILQHYEVCATPLLDVTHSLRIAASFASDGATNEAYIFVLGVPNLSGAITASAEAGIQIVRLSSVCPPSAVRPHIQEGYLLGTYPDMASFDQKQNYAHYEIDFGRRLVAKFRFNPRTFWKSNRFPRVDRAALYPNKSDPMFRLTDAIRRQLPQ
jgi:hypothetical protein